MPRCTTLPGAGLVRNLQATAGVVMGAGRRAPGSGVGTGASSEEEEGGVAGRRGDCCPHPPAGLGPNSWAILLILIDVTE